MEKGSCPPLLKRLLAHAREGYLGFHTPGHKQGRGAWPPWLSLLGEAVFALDLTELPGLDSLHDPQGVIREAAAAAAACFGADETYFLVNGASAGIAAVILATCGPGDRVILPRNCHQSAIHGLILSGAEPVYLPVYGDPASGLPGMVMTDDLRRAWDEASGEVRLAVFLHPSYYGLVGELEEQVRLAHERGCPVLVDEAHGPHFFTSDLYPPSALSCGADFVVHGAHKVLGAFTQAAFLHRRGNDGIVSRLRAALRLVQTTSPSYLLMASLDVSRQQSLEERQRWEELAAEALRLREQISRLPGVSAVGSEALRVPGVVGFDPARLVVSVRGLGITGFEAAEWLRSRRRILVEMADLHNLVFILGPSDLPLLEELLSGLADLASAFGAEGKSPPSSFSGPFGLPIPPQAMAPRQAFFSQWEAVRIEDAVGRVAAEAVAPYPPGVAVVCPGEVVTAEAVAFLKEWERAGGFWLGQTQGMLRVVKRS
ncbi:MAG: aminotransferase class I/II-fold pyridoxal phosphate-dependent enzyme [Thermacetogeniaceae bacterium]